MGVWTPISYFSGHAYNSYVEAVDAATQRVPWLRPPLNDTTN
jgi:hypothetical protein